MHGEQEEWMYAGLVNYFGPQVSSHMMRRQPGSLFVTRKTFWDSQCHVNQTKWLQTTVSRLKWLAAWNSSDKVEMRLRHAEVVVPPGLSPTDLRLFEKQLQYLRKIVSPTMTSLTVHFVSPQLSQRLFAALSRPSVVEHLWLLRLSGDFDRVAFRHFISASAVTNIQIDVACAADVDAINSGCQYLEKLTFREFNGEFGDMELSCLSTISSLSLPSVLAGVLLHIDAHQAPPMTMQKQQQLNGPNGNNLEPFLWEIEFLDDDYAWIDVLSKMTRKGTLQRFRMPKKLARSYLSTNELFKALAPQRETLVDLGLTLHVDDPIPLADLEKFLKTAPNIRTLSFSDLKRYKRYNFNFINSLELESLELSGELGPYIEQGIIQFIASSKSLTHLSLDLYMHKPLDFFSPWFSIVDAVARAPSLRKIELAVPLFLPLEKRERDDLYNQFMMSLLPLYNSSKPFFLNDVSVQEIVNGTWSSGFPEYVIEEQVAWIDQIPCDIYCDYTAARLPLIKQRVKA